MAQQEEQCLGLWHPVLKCCYSASDHIPVEVYLEAADDGWSGRACTNDMEILMEPRFLASAWCSPGYCTHLGSEPADGSIYLSAFQIDENKTLKKI